MVRGQRVHYQVAGSGEPLVLIHGLAGSARWWRRNVAALAGQHTVYLVNLPGFGSFRRNGLRFTLAEGAAWLGQWIEAVGIAPCHVIAHSMGGYLTISLAAARPDLVRRLVLISGQYHADGLLPGLLPPDFADDPAAAAATMTSSRLARRYGEVSPDGPEHFLAVTEKILQMAATEPRLEAADLAGVSARTLVVCADDDAIAPEHTLALYRGIPEAELAVVPGTSHVLISEKPDLVAQLVLGFLTTDPRPTIAPIRRRR
jgi:pimeloyl-ACP methyl ester carboxylesterase